MSDVPPLITIIIPSRPGPGDIQAVRGAQRLDYPKDRLEILVARGRQPAVQRNAALRVARGELIYFLDDDSVAASGNLRRAVELFKNGQVQMIGGPNLCPADAPWLEQVFAVVLASWLAFGPSRARYDAIGSTRPSSEKELILCNMMARRAPVLEAGGFDEALYPNEENALMDELQKRGAILLYDPEFLVHRRPRPSLRAFCRMLMTYGRGRAEQVRLHPTLGSLPNFGPPLLCVYLVLALVSPYWFGLLPLLPLVPYAVALLLQTFVSMARGKGVARSLMALPLLVATHLFYGIGFWRGLFTRLRRVGEKPVTPVELESVALSRS